VKGHNEAVENSEDPITSVLCPGLGTAVGKMPPKRCAFQMRQAFEVCALGRQSSLASLSHLGVVSTHHETMKSYL